MTALFRWDLDYFNIPRCRPKNISQNKWTRYLLEPIPNFPIINCGTDWCYKPAYDSESSWL